MDVPYRFSELIDRNAIERMAEANYRISGISVALVDPVDGTVLVQVGLQDICREFHRAHPVSCSRCLESDQSIREHVRAGEAHEYRCRNGMRDIGLPVFVKGEHLATLFLGQFFYEGEEPERDFFARQADELGYDKEKYLAALDKVPIITREKVKAILEYNHAFAEFLGHLAEQSRELREREDRLRLGLKAASQGLYDIHVPSGRMTVNAEHAERFGYSPSEVDAIGSWWSEVVHPDDRARVSETYRRYLEGRIPEYRTEFRQRTKDGDWRWVLSQGSIVERAGDGTPLRMLGTYTDITERKRTEEALEQRLIVLTGSSESTEDVRFEELFNVEDIQSIQDAFANATGVASIITDPDGRPITRPSNFCRLCRDVIRKTEKGLENCYRSDAVLGRMNPGGPIVQPCLSGGLWDGGASICAGEHHIANWLIGQVLDENIDTEAMLAYGREIGADPDEFRSALKEVTHMPKEQFAHVCRALFLIADQLSRLALQNMQQARYITERKRAEEERLRLEAQVQQAQKLESLGVLAGGIAHDFNNMLMAIIGNAELLRQDLPEDAETRSFVEAIDHTAHRAADLCRQMLAYSGKGRFVVQPLDLSELVHEISPMLKISVSKKATLRYSLPKGLPSVEADATQIRQVAMNLVINASEAIGEKQGVVTVTTGYMHCDHEYVMSAQIRDRFQAGHHVYLEVSDTGCGMDAATLEKIFDPFYSTKFTGRGLGLAAVSGIVRGHRGGLRVESVPGKGTAFRVLFPMVAAEPVASSLEEDERDWRGHGTVLLVDDEESLLMVCRRMLERLGFDVLTAADGLAALEVYRKEKARIRAVLLDLTMPRMDGEETFHELLKLSPEVKVVMSSGYNAQEVADRFVGRGVAGFIQKPYRLGSLASVLRCVLVD